VTLPTIALLNSDLELLTGLPPIQVVITAPEAFAILAQLQLASRHPANTGATATIARRFARALQQAIAITPTLRTLAEAGWNPACDVPTDHKEPDHA